MQSKNKTKESGVKNGLLNSEFKLEFWIWTLGLNSELLNSSGLTVP